MLKKRILSMLLVAVMVVSMIPVNAVAEETETQTPLLDNRTCTLTADRGVDLNGTRVFGTSVGYTLSLKANENEIEAPVITASFTPAGSFSNVDVQPEDSINSDGDWVYKITAEASGESVAASLNVELNEDSVSASFKLDLDDPTVEVEWLGPEGEGDNAEMIANVTVKDELPVEVTYNATAGETAVEPSINENTYTFSFGGQNICHIEFTATDAVGNTGRIQEEDKENIIDTQIPVIDGMAYTAGNETGVKISYTVGLSGVQQVLVDNLDVTALCVDNAYAGKVTGKNAGDKVTVKVTGNNGKSATKDLTVVGSPEIEVSYTQLGANDENIYLAAGSKITLKAYNLISENPEFTVTDGGNDVPLESSWAQDGGCWKTTIKVTKETNLLELTVKVVDGNGRTATHVETKAITCDTEAPTIDVTNIDVTADKDETVYKDSVFETVITIQDDVALDEKTISVKNNGNDVKLTEDNGSYKATIKVLEGESLKLEISATDKSNNPATYESPTVIVDTVLPEVIVETNAQNSNNTEQKIKFTVKEANIETNKITVYYEDNKETTVLLEGDAGEYSGSINVEDGQVISNIQIDVKDKAGNRPEKIKVSEGVGIEFTDTDGIFNLNGEILVDETPPEVTVERTTEEGCSMHQYNEVEYHNGEVTYTITVKDKFVERFIESEVAVYPTINGEEAKAVVSEWKEVAEDQYRGSFTVEDGQVLTNIRIVVVDAGGNTPGKIEGEEIDGEIVGAYKVDADNSLVWDGQIPVCVDTTGPKVEISFSDNVGSYYTNDGKTFVKLDTTDPEAEAEVQMHVKIMDTNITADDNSNYYVKSNVKDDNGEWKFSEDGTGFTYTKTVRVTKENTGAISFDLSIFDLAGNPVQSVEVVTAKDGTELPEFAKGNSDAPAIIEGKIGGTIVVDRRNPEGVDNNAPQLTIEGIKGTKTGDTVNKGGETVPIYSDNLTYHVTMRDIDKVPADGESATTENSSGLKKMSWSIIYPEEDGDVFKASSGEFLYDSEYICSKEQDISLNINKDVESNDVVLTIKVEDNVGNVSTYQIPFAIDNYAPRVNVEYSTTAGNSPYFRETREATITVKDINWSEDTTAITIDGTTANVSGWNSENNEHSCTILYETEGEYTFSISSTDLAKNVSSANNANIKEDNPKGIIGNVTFKGPDNANYQFVIDKTEPKIVVTYNPATPVDTDEQSVEYYDEERTATVEITERNFNDADLSTADWGRWIDSGSDIHKISARFGEGNKYQVTVSCTDRAGNEAKPYAGPTFSVDLTAPTIEITKGTMTNDTLNIVQGDLELGFTINDGQDNLKTFYVTMLHLNSQFQQVEVDGSGYYTLTNVGDRTTGYVDVANLVKEKAYDGIYSVQVTAVDYAGHTVSLTPALYISVNRFGSSFMITDEYTKNFLTGQNGSQIFRNEVAQNLIIQEINPNRVWQNSQQTQAGSLITMAFNGNAVELVPGTNYTVTEQNQGSGNNSWYVYTYEIYTDNFYSGTELVDGRYKLLFYSEDDAGNKNANETNEGSSLTSYDDGSASGSAEFVLDHMDPVITIIGLNSGDEIMEDYKTVEIAVSDNTAVSVSVYVNGEQVELTEYSEDLPKDQVWFAYDAESGKYLLNITKSTSRQDIRVVAVDAAGNEIESSVDEILLTSNWLVQYVNNVPALCITFLTLAAIVILIFFLVKKKKKEKAAA